MIEAVRGVAVLGQSLRQRPERGRDVLGGGRAAALVVDHADLVTGLGQPQHGLGEVGAMRGVDPGQAHCHSARVRGGDRLLAFELRLAIDAGRAGGVVLKIRPGLGPVEHEVGREVDKRGADLLRGFGGRSRPIAVERERGIGLALGPVDRGIGSGVDHDVRAMRGDGTTHAVRVGQIDRGPAKCCGVNVARTLHQRMRDLPARPEDQRLHLVVPSRSPA